MRIVALIAWREYLENIRTRGFWIGVLLIPVLFVGIYFIQTTLAASTPTRYYLLLDQSNKYRGAVQAAIDLEHQRRTLREFVDYLLTNRRDGDLEATNANANRAVDNLVDDVGTDEVAALNEWMENGGLDFALTMAAPSLKENAPTFVPPKRQFVEVPVPVDIPATAPAEEVIIRLKPYLDGSQGLPVADNASELGELFALILIPADIESQLIRPETLTTLPSSPASGVQYWARNLTDSRLPDAIERGINNEVRRNEFVARGMDTSVVRNVQRTRLPFSRLDPAADAGEEAVSMADTFRQFAPMVFVYAMFIALMQSVQYLLSNTIEEKSNRIIEVLLASVTPDELMMGKLLGIGLSSLTTITVWLLSLVLFLSAYQSSQTVMIMQVLEVILSSELIPWFIFYSLAGFALYSGLFLAIGSLCNTLKEAQGLMMPLVLLMVIPVTVMPFVVLDPNGTVFRAMSWFPLFTPYMMMNRAAANPPLVDVIGTTIVLLASIVLMLWLSGKIFRLGVLRSGQPPRLLELISLIGKQ